jgi:hypothetical protein
MQCRKGRSNLLPFHRTALRFLQASTDTIIVQCDKNLGPTCIDIPSYIELAFNDHLNDPSTYRFVTVQDAQRQGDLVRKSLKQWNDGRR